MDWDSEIENDGNSFELLRDGIVVEFEVVEFEKARSAKGSPMAKLDLSLFDGENFGRCKDQLVLMDSVEWKLCQFFTCIGQRKPGDTLKPKWNKVKGAKGFALIGIREYITDNGRGEKREVNEIKKYLTPQDGQKRYDEQIADQVVAAEDGGSKEAEDDLAF